MNLKEIALTLGLLVPGAVSAQDTPKEPPKATALEMVVEKGETFHMPFHSFENHGMALAIIEKAQEQMQEHENKNAAEQKRAPRRIEFTSEESMWYAETELNFDGYNGVTVGEVLQKIAKDPVYKGLTAKKVSSASMELGKTSYANEDADAAEKLNTLLAKKAKDSETENSPLFRRMMKSKIAKTYGAKKVKTEEGQSVLITNEMVDRFEKDAAKFYLPGQKITAETPEAAELENSYIVDFEISTESPADLAFALRYIDLKTAYGKITSSEFPKNEEERIYTLSEMAGKDNVLSGTELEEKIAGLDAKIAELRSSEDKEHKELDWGEVSIGTESKVKGYIKVSMDKEDKKRMKTGAAKYSLTPAEQLVWLRNSCKYDSVKKEGSMTNEQVNAAIQALDNKYKEDKK